MGTKLKTYTVNGVAFEITVTEGGDFCAIVDGSAMKTSSLKTLEEKIKKHVRMSYKIAVPVTFIDGELNATDKLTIRQGTLTGIHAGNQNVIAKDDKTGVTEQLRYFDGHCLRRLEGPEIQAFVQLNRKACQAMQAVREYLEARAIHPGTAVGAAAQALRETVETKG